MTILYTILLVAAVVLLGAAFFMSTLVVRIKTYSDEEIYHYEEKAGTLDRRTLDRKPAEEVAVASPYGYTLRGRLYPAPRDRGKAVILAHGVTSTLVGALKYMELFHRRGFHVLAYDHRRHGRSGGTSTTYGYYEKYDLKACVDWLKERYGRDCRIGVFGESMGAATALQHAAIDDRAAFYVLDCSYSDLKAELRYRLKLDFRLPPFPMLPLASLFTWLRSGMRFGRVSPIRDIAGVETPMLFIHGDADRYIPKEMTVALYEAKAGMKRLFLMPGADHAQSIRTDAAAYDRVVGSFLQELGLADGDPGEGAWEPADRGDGGNSKGRMADAENGGDGGVRTADLETSPV